MTEKLSNDQAFIKVSKELILLQNDLQALRLVEKAAGGLNQYSRGYLEDAKPQREHSPHLAGLTKALYYLGNTTELRNEIARLEKRIEELTKLAETYIRGGNIILEKLSRE